jgi:hypothetical protein
MERRILYYPEIEPDDGPWLRQALLYWDRVACIFPNEFEGSESSNLTRPYMRELVKANAIKPYYPYEIQGSGDDVSAALCKELVQKLESPRFKALMARTRSGSNQLPGVKIFASKIGHDAFHALKKRRLIEKNVEWQQSASYLVEPHAAHLYMTLLARYLAQGDNKNATVIGTDTPEYQEISLRPSSGHLDHITCAQLSLKALPVPRNDVDLLKIVEFKEENRDSLLHFRTEYMALQEALAKCPDKEAVKDVLINFQEKIEARTRDLRKDLDAERINTVLGTIKAVISSDLAKALSKIGWIGIVASAVAGHLIIPGTVIAAAGLTSFDLLRFGVERHKVRSDAMNKSGFAFLYQAHAQGMLDFPGQKNSYPTS